MNLSKAGTNLGATEGLLQQVCNDLKLECCPLCKSENICKKGNLAYRDEVIFSTNKIKLSHLPELWKCRECLSCFVQHIVDADTARILYSTGQADERWPTAAFDQSKTSNVIDSIREVFQNRNSVLDVGCNTGELLDFARSFGCKTSGVEFSSASRSQLAVKGHTGYLTLEEATGEYDVITAFDLVEHLYDIPAFLKECHRKLSDGGKLIILTGNIGCMSAKLSGAQWWYTQYPEHIVFPSKKYFAEYSGFNIEKWLTTYAAKGYVSSVCKGFWAMLKGMVRGRTFTGLPSLGPDHVLVVLRK